MAIYEDVRGQIHICQNELAQLVGQPQYIENQIMDAKADIQ